MSQMPQVELDVNKITSDLLSRTLGKAVDAVAKYTGSKVEDLQIRLGSAFTRYLDEQLKRRSKVKTLLYRDQPQYIYKFYVPQDLKQKNSPTIEDVSVSHVLTRSKHILITGTGGLGKSILSRHLFIDFIRSSDYIPFFVELRSVNPNGNTLEDILFKELDLAGVTSPEVLRRCMQEGRFALVLDGLDEVLPEKRDAVSEAIRAIATEMPSLPIVVTSRPDDRFIGWDGFAVFQIQPLTLPKVKQLLFKLEYDEPVKRRFLAAIDGGLWETHQTFLANPLLLTILLLTFDTHASIPTRMSSFYQQVFETLWNRHDATKDGYKRTIKSSINRDDFLSLAQAFAFHTYWKSSNFLDGNDVSKAIEFAKTNTGLNIDSAAFKTDLVEALCILNEDAFSYTFSHRLFQEYFAARFLVLGINSTQRASVLPKIVKSAVTDQVLNLAWELDKHLIESEVLLPALERLEQAMSGKTADEQMKIWALAWSAALNFRSSISGEMRDVYFTPSDQYQMLQFIRKHYLEKVGKEIASSILPRRDEAMKSIRRRLNLENRPTARFETDSLPLEFFSKDLGNYAYIFSRAHLASYLNLAATMRSELKKSSASLEQLLNG